jgi:hypothetical protein
MPFAEIKTALAKGARVTGVSNVAPPPVIKGAYAWVIELTDYNAHRALWQLQSEGVLVKTALRPFTCLVEGKQKDFGYGTLIIPAGGQQMKSDDLHVALSNVSTGCNIQVHAVATGYNLGGIDLGSGFRSDGGRKWSLCL